MIYIAIQNVTNILVKGHEGEILGMCEVTGDKFRAHRTIFIHVTQ
jgi:hypothetical protein